MENKAKLFLKTIESLQDTALLTSITLFLEEEGDTVLYKNGQLFFIQEKNILRTEALETDSNLILSFDGTSMQRIDQDYYLGASVMEARQYDMFGSIDLNLRNTSSNNNNNNNNNGNNNNG